jgi:hypothetical protein
MSSPEESLPVDDLKQPTSEVLNITFVLPEAVSHVPKGQVELEKVSALVDRIKPFAPRWKGDGFRIRQTHTRQGVREERIIDNFHFCFVKTDKGDARLTTTNLRGYQYLGEKKTLVSQDRLPQTVFYDPESVCGVTLPGGRSGREVERAYTQEEYQKLVEERDRRAQETQGAMEAQAAEAERSDQLKRMVDSEPIKDLLTRCAKEAGSIGTGPITLDLDHELVTVELLEKNGSAVLSEDGTPIVTRNIVISSVHPEGPGVKNHSSVECHIQVKGWRGFGHWQEPDSDGYIRPGVYSEHSVTFDPDHMDIKYNLKYAPSGAVLETTCRATDNKPMVQEGKIVQDITGMSEVGSKICITKPVYDPYAFFKAHSNERSISITGEHDVSREVADLDVALLIQEMQKHSIMEIGPIPEKIAIKSVDVAEALTRVFYSASGRSGLSWRDDSGPSLTMIQRQVILEVDMDGIPTTETPSPKQLGGFFKLTSFDTLDPLEIRQKVESHFKQDRGPVSLILSFYRRLTPEGQVKFAKNYPEEYKQLQGIQSYIDQLPDILTEAVSKNVMPLDDVHLVINGDTSSDSILGYAIYRHKIDGSYRWSSPPDSIHVLPTTSAERDMISQLKEFDGMPVDTTSRLVPVVKTALPTQSTIHADRLFVVRSAENGHLFDHLPIDGTQLLSEDYNQLMESLKSDVKDYLSQNTSVSTDGRGVINSLNQALSLLNPESVLDATGESSAEDDIPGILPPFNKQYQARLKELDVVLNYLKSKVINPDLYEIQEPEKIRIILSQMEAIRSKVIESQDHVSKEILQTFIEWNTLGRQEYDGVWGEDVLPGEDTGYRKIELGDINSHISGALSIFGPQVFKQEDNGYFSKITLTGSISSLSLEQFMRLRTLYSQMQKVVGESSESEMYTFDKKSPLPENSTFSGLAAIGDANMEYAWMGGPLVDNRTREITVPVPTTRLKTTKEKGRLAARTVIDGVDNMDQTFSGKYDVKFDPDLQLPGGGTYRVQGVVLNEGKGKHKSGALYFNIQSLEPVDSQRDG